MNDHYMSRSHALPYYRSHYRTENNQSHKYVPQYYSTPRQSQYYDLNRTMTRDPQEGYKDNENGYRQLRVPSEQIMDSVFK